MLDRRGFLKFVGGAGAGILATPVIWKSIDDSSIWSQNWPWVPVPARGETTYARTISKLCPSGLGIRVRLIGDRPVTVHGDPDHPLSQGALNALAASEAQLLYSPARLKQPLKRGADGKHTPISWDEAQAILQDGLRNAKGGLCAISGDATSSMNEVLSALASACAGSFYLMPGEEQAAHAAWNLMGGTGRLGYDIGHSDMVLAIGAGVLESWGTVVRNRKAWSAGRPVGEKATFHLAYAGPVQDNTATGADWWLPTRCGRELAVALGVAHLLIKAGRSAGLPDSNDFAALAAAWTPEKVEQVSGVPAKKLQEVTAALLKARAPLVIVGSPLNQGGGAAAIMAGVACNLLLHDLNRNGGLRALPDTPPVVPGAMDAPTMRGQDLMAFVNGLAKAPTAPGALIVYEANPVYALPGAATALLDKVPFKVSFTCFMDETAQQCDLILPAAMGLERFDDAETPYGSGEIMYSLATPVTAPLYEARPAGELLLDTAKKLGMPLPFADMVAVLKAKTDALGADWVTLSNGDAFVNRAVVNQTGLRFNAPALAKAATALATTAAAPSLGLAPTVRLGVGTPETGIPPYAVKLVTAREVYRGLSVVHMNAATAAALKLRNGAPITVTGPGGSCKALLLVDEGVGGQTATMLLGGGHTAFDAFSQHKGSNLLQLAAPTVEPGTGLTVWSAIDVSIAGA